MLVNDIWGGEILKGSRKLDAAKRLLAESGYAGQPIVSMAAQDIALHKACGDVTSCTRCRST